MEVLLNLPKLLKRWSGRRDSNPRRPAWEAGILPLNYSRILKALFRKPLKRAYLSIRILNRKGKRRALRSDGKLVVTYLGWDMQERDIR